MPVYNARKPAPREYPDCLLCEYTRGSDYFTAMLNLGINTREKRISESEHFVLMHDIQPVVPGHCLLMTKAHYLAFAELPAQLHGELKQILQLAISSIAKRYSPPVIFEHGSVDGEQGSGICINHAHLHLIPTSVDIKDQIQNHSRRRIQCRPVNICDDLKNINNHYLYYQNAWGNGCVVTDPKLPLPQQFIRRIIAEKTGTDAWDWKQAMYRNNG